MAPQSQREQFKPLAPFIPSSAHFRSPGPGPSPEDQQHKSERQIIRIRKFIRWCGCVTALVLLFGVIILVLGFTVYNVKEPKARMNGVTILNGTFANGVTDNVTLLVDFSVKNTNAFTFRYGNTTTTVYYEGRGIGEGTTPPGKAKARRTMRFNVTMEVMPKKVMDNPNYNTDIRDQSVNFSSYTRIDGNVKIFNLFMRKVAVELNCTSQYNITTGLLTRGDNCVGYVDT